MPATTPDVLARETIRAQVKRESKGKLCKVAKSYVEREMERRSEKGKNQQL